MNTKSSVSILAVLAVAFAAGVFTACNSLSSDPDNVSPATADPVPVYAAKKPVVINLLSRVANAASVSITKQPVSGTLARVGEGLYQYTPASPNAASHDSFDYAARDNAKTLLATKRVTISLFADSVELPCALYANNDVATVNPASLNNWVNIDILANDILCGLNDSTNLQLSIFREPVHGTAIPGPGWSRLQIVYTSQDLTATSDSVIYQLQSKSDPASVSYGLIVINFSTACVMKLESDSYKLSYDSLNGGIARLLVLANDQLCGTSTVSVSLNPNYGSAIFVDSVSVSGSRYLQYAPSPVALHSVVLDSLEYTVCAGGVCKTAGVRIQNLRP